MTRRRRSAPEAERKRETGDEDGEAGFVLLSVLLAAILFVGVAASFAVRARLVTLQTGNRSELARAQALADGAALFVADALRPPPRQAPTSQAILAAALSGEATAAPPPEPLPLPFDGTPLSCALPGGGGGRLELSAVDQGALLDLNGASVPMLRDFFEAAGLGGETARRLAEEIGDFRDPDDDPQSNGIGERAQYWQAGLAWGPANRPFVDVEEVARLPSVTPALLARLRPLLTVQNPRAGLDLALTPAASHGVLPPEATERPNLKRWQLASSRTNFAVDARLRRGDGSLAAGRRALVTFGGPDNGELRVLRWSRPPFGEDKTSAAPSQGDAFCSLLATALGTAREAASATLSP
ncbi:type II secretion system protein GspK [Aureimonas ureilytica]|uniref:type II secretion system protein GspK n=1 Tax=Aureimonas ureilytica TaxID=401562 RepID=UPI0003800223|nr:type II secretion system protein GspK [Aureimonas ureilytica]